MDDDQIIQIANTILAQLTVPKRVHEIKDVNASLFITIFEGLCGESIPDLILPTKTAEDEIHNVQSMLDSLAMDILHTSLSHITGEDIVQGRKMSIVNLLDIFSGLLEYILDGIAKDEVANGVKSNTDFEQSLLRDAVMKDSTNFLKGGTSQSSDDNTDDLIALGDDKYLRSPTSSPSSKKRRSSKKSVQMQSKRVTPHTMSQPLASSSMASIQPSSTDTESDASIKQVPVSRALMFSKVPAELDISIHGSYTTARDVTFTMPKVQPEKKVAQKLAAEILHTGESTEELIALGDTQSDDTLYDGKRQKSSVVLKEKSQQDKPISVQKARGSKRERVPKRHVCFVSESSSADDTLADVNTKQLEEVNSEGDFKKPLPSVSTGHENSDVICRLESYFARKEALGGGGDKPSSTQKQISSIGHEASELMTAQDKSAVLYERVTALRTAASEKLDALSKKSSSDYITAKTPSDYQSDYVRSKFLQTGLNAGSASDEFVTALSTNQAPQKKETSSEEENYRTANTGFSSRSFGLYTTASRNMPKSINADTYGTAVQSNVLDLHSTELTANPNKMARNNNLLSERYETASEMEPSNYMTTASKYSKEKEEEDDSSRFISASDHFEGPLSVITKDKNQQPLKASPIEPDFSNLPMDEKRVRFYKPQTKQKSKSQTMYEAIKKVLDEEKWKERLEQKMLAKQYKDDLSDMVELHRERLVEERQEAEKQQHQFTTNVQKLIETYTDQPKKPVINFKPKGYLLPKTRVIKKKVARRSKSLSPERTTKPLDPDDDDFLPNLMEEFPYLYLAPETIKKMWMDHQQQSAAIIKILENDKRKRSKAKTTIEDAEKRQKILMEIMQKEVEHTKRVKQLREKENAEIENKRKNRETRLQTARVHKYYDDYAIQMKSSMLKNKTKEEQLFKRLFAEGLQIQKERMHALRSYTREQRTKRAKQQQIDVEALETFYKDQFGMLAESVAQEKKNVETRDTAQAKVLDKMKKELRKKMENDIRNFQDQLKRDEDDFYFRELDAQKVVQKLNMTRYQTGY